MHVRHDERILLETFWFHLSTFDSYIRRA